MMLLPFPVRAVFVFIRIIFVGTYSGNRPGFIQNKSRVRKCKQYNDLGARNFWWWFGWRFLWGRHDVWGSFLDTGSGAGMTMVGSVCFPLFCVVLGGCWGSFYSPQPTGRHAGWGDFWMSARGRYADGGSVCLPFFCVVFGGLLGFILFTPTYGAVHDDGRSIRRQLSRNLRQHG